MNEALLSDSIDMARRALASHDTGSVIEFSFAAMFYASVMALEKAVPPIMVTDVMRADKMELIKAVRREFVDTGRMDSQDLGSFEDCVKLRKRVFDSDRRTVDDSSVERWQDIPAHLVIKALNKITGVSVTAAKAMVESAERYVYAIGLAAQSIRQHERQR